MKKRYDVEIEVDWISLIKECISGCLLVIKYMVLPLLFLFFVLFVIALFMTKGELLSHWGLF